LKLDLTITAPGNVIDHVVIERESESTVMFVEGAKEAYLGYVTLKVSKREKPCLLIVVIHQVILPMFR